MWVYFRTKVEIDVNLCHSNNCDITNPANIIEPFYVLDSTRHVESVQDLANSRFGRIILSHLTNIIKINELLLTY